MTTRTFSPEFKIEAAKRVTDRDVTVAHAALELDLAERVLRRWMRHRPFPLLPFPGTGTTRRSGPERSLEEEVARFRVERDILKRVAAFFARKEI